MKEERYKALNRLQINFTEDQIKYINRQAKELDVFKSEVVRRIIDKMIEIRYNLKKEVDNGRNTMEDRY
jgi:hypothetical protein